MKKYTLISNPTYEKCELNIVPLRIHLLENVVKIDLGILYSKGSKNELTITDKIGFKVGDKTLKFSRISGIELNEKIELTSVNDYKYFSLEFEGTAQENDVFELYDESTNLKLSQINNKNAKAKIAEITEAIEALNFLIKLEETMENKQEWEQDIEKLKKRKAILEKHLK